MECILFFKGFESISDLLKNRKLLTSANQCFFSSQICEVGGLVIMHKRTKGITRIGGHSEPAPTSALW